MSGAIFDPWPLVRLAGAVIAAGLAIKLMDDYLDREFDALVGRRTVAAWLGPGTVAYALAALAVATLLEAQAAGTLFLASYAVGMAHEPGRRLPTGLTAWQESLLAAVLGLVLGGFAAMCSATAAMFFVQCADDFRDAASDRMAGGQTLASRLGRVETGMLAVAALLVALAINPLLAIVVAAGAALVDALLRWAARRLPPMPGETAGEGEESGCSSRWM